MDLAASDHVCARTMLCAIMCLEAVCVLPAIVASIVKNPVQKASGAWIVKICVIVKTKMVLVQGKRVFPSVMWVFYETSHL